MYKKFLVENGDDTEGLQLVGYPLEITSCQVVEVEKHREVRNVET